MVAGGDRSDPDGAADDEVDPASRGVAVHAIIAAVRTAAVACGHEQGRRIIGDLDVISITLPRRPRGASHPIETRRKCDKTTPFALTRARPSSYLAFALIGVNRGRGAGKGR